MNRNFYISTAVVAILLIWLITWLLRRPTINIKNVDWEGQHVVGTMSAKGESEDIPWSPILTKLSKQRDNILFESKVNGKIVTLMIKENGKILKETTIDFTNKTIN